MYLCWKYEVIYRNDVSFSMRISHFPILETIRNVRDFSKMEEKNSTATRLESNSQLKYIQKIKCHIKGWKQIRSELGGYL